MSTIESLSREFHHKNQVLQDPDPSLSPQEVLEFYSNAYPELTSAHVTEKEITAEKAVYEFKVATGTKG